MQTSIGERLLHLAALPGVERHRFLDTAMLAGGSDLQAVGVVTVGGVAMYTASTSGSLINASTSV